jgi:hypothetical protein
MSKVVIKIEVPVEVMVNETCRTIAQHIENEIESMLVDAEDNIEMGLDIEE